MAILIQRTAEKRKNKEKQKTSSGKNLPCNDYFLYTEFTVLIIR